MPKQRLQDMSDQGGVGSVSKAEATLTHPSARDRYAHRACAPCKSKSKASLDPRVRRAEKKRGGRTREPFY